MILKVKIIVKLNQFNRKRIFVQIFNNTSSYFIDFKSDLYKWSKTCTFMNNTIKKLK